jgi:hypothetical protein
MLDIIPSSPTHYAYPPSMLRDTHLEELTDEAWDAIMAVLDTVNGKMIDGTDGWGIAFETSDDKMMFLLSLAWNK